MCTLAQSGATSETNNENASSSAGVGYLLSHVVTTSQSFTETGDNITGGYTDIGTESNATTNIQSSSTSSTDDTYTETQSQSDSYTDIGNSIYGADTLTQAGTRSHSITDHGTAGGYAYSVNQFDSGGFTRTTSTDDINQTYSWAENSTDTYTLSETSATSAGTWSLVENGADGITTVETGNSLNGLYTQNQTGADSYTITESGTLGSGSYSLTLTGNDNVNQLETGNSIAATFSRTTAGGGSYTRTETGGTLGSASSTNAYSLTVTDRFGLIEQFDNIANTNGVATPGHMQYHAFGGAYTDDPPPVAPNRRQIPETELPKDLPNGLIVVGTGIGNANPGDYIISQAYFKDEKVISPDQIAGVEWLIHYIQVRYAEVNGLKVPKGGETATFKAVANGKPNDVLINIHGNYSSDGPLKNFNVGQDKLAPNTDALKRFTERTKEMVGTLKLAVCGVGYGFDPKNPDKEHIVYQLANGMSSEDVRTKIVSYATTLTVEGKIYRFNILATEAYYFHVDKNTGDPIEFSIPTPKK